MISIYPDMSFYLNNSNDINNIMTKTPQNFYALPVMTDSNQPTQTPTLLSQQQPANYHHNLLTHDNFNQNNNNLSVGMPFMNTNNIHYHPQVASDINPFPVYDNPYYYTHYRVSPLPPLYHHHSMTDLDTYYPSTVRRSSMNTSRSSSPCSVHYKDALGTRSSSPVNKRYSCRLCNKRFTRPSSLATHMYSHTGEKPFKCLVEGCGRNFSVVSNLRRHAKIHGNSDILPTQYSSLSSTVYSSP